MVRVRVRVRTRLSNPQTIELSVGLTNPRIVDPSVPLRESPNTILYDTIQRLHSKTHRTCQFSIAHKN